MCLAIPGRITTILAGDGLERRALVEVDGTEREISLGLIDDAQVGDYVVSHSGFALRLAPDPRKWEGELTVP
ncbi:MAG: HypC/HybG/HupF family hydrogenase formation chaperone [Acidimicrobiia bacterium]